MRNRPNINVLTKDTIELATSGLRDARDSSAQEYYNEYTVEEFLKFIRDAGISSEFKPLITVEQEVIAKSSKFPFLSNYVTPKTIEVEHFDSTISSIDEVRIFRTYVERLIG